MLTSVFGDLRYAVRMLERSPAFAAVAILTLALGIGGNTAIFSFIEATMLRPPAYPEPERIVNVWERPPAGGRQGVSTLNFLDWRHQSTVFDALAIGNTGTTTWVGDGDPIQLGAAFVSANYFGVFGVHAALGHTFDPKQDLEGDVPAENALGTGDRVVISYKAWQEHFGGDQNIIGRKLNLHSAPRTVIGVLPKDSPFDHGFPEIWFLHGAFEQKDMSRNFRFLPVYARLKPGITLEQARAEMDVLGARLEKQYPESNKGWGITLERFLDHRTGTDLKQSLYVLMAAVGAVLLIACANLANLTLARAAAREKEIAIRASLGASQWRLIGQCLTENLLLSLLGGSLGLALGCGMVAGVKALMPPYMLPQDTNVNVDPTVLLFTLAIAILTGIIFGIAPALRAARPNLTGSMKEGGSTTSSKGSLRLRGALVVFEIALAFILLTGAGLLIRSFEELNNANIGVDGTNVLTMNVPFMMTKFKEGSQAASYAHRMLEGVGSIPGVRDVAVTWSLPLEGGNFTRFQIAGRPPVEPTKRDGCFMKMISDGYFRLLGIQLKSGRSLAEADVKGAPPVAMINEAMAKKYFPNQNPIGERILIPEVLYGKRQFGADIAWEVVGVVGDELMELGDIPRPAIYVPYAQHPMPSFSLVVKGTADPKLMISAIRHEVKQVDATQAVTDVLTIDGLKSMMQSSNRLRTTLLGVFAALALALAIIGIYGVVSYLVAQRTHEMGLRMALGASQRNILALVLKNGVLLIGAGLAIGAAGALVLTRLLRSLLFGVSATDPLTLGSVAGLLAGIALIACYFPAHRATEIDPMVALRQE